MWISEDIDYLVFQIIWETLDSTTYKSSTQFKAMKKNTFMPILYDYPMKDTLTTQPHPYQFVEAGGGWVSPAAGWWQWPGPPPLSSHLT